MEISHFKQTDLEAVKSIIKECFGKHSSMYSLSIRDSIVVGKEDDKIIAVAGLIRRLPHNKVPSVVIAVLPLFRRKGIGSKLHKSLLAQHPLNETEIGIDGCCYEDQYIAREFLTKLGYKKYLDCRCATLKINGMKSIKLDYEVQSCSQFFEMENRKKEFNVFIVERYIEEHYWSPPLHISHSAWNEIGYDDYSHDLSFVINEDGQILGGSLAYRTEEDLEIGWVYAIKDGIGRQIKILKNLLFKQLSTAKSAGIERGFMEIDSTHWALSALLDWLPIKDMRIWQRFRLDK